MTSPPANTSCTRGAEGKRRNQGRHECEVWRRDAELAEGAHAWEACTKNPGHANFIPASKFAIRHLPITSLKKTFFKWICAVMALTVRIRVNYTSEERPHGYTFSDYRGQSTTHVGSGLITSIHPGTGRCCCGACCDNPKPHRRWWIVTVKTACHVVFDTSEANRTFVDAFYESEASLSNGEMKTMHGWRLYRKDVEEDWCFMQCIIHDADLAKRLTSYVKAKSTITAKLADEQSALTSENFCAIVSHPHGCSKRVTFGKVTEWAKVDGKIDYHYIYTSGTCCGSSGAPVLVPWKLEQKSWPGSWSRIAVHSYALDGGENQSADGLFIPYTSTAFRRHLETLGTRMFHTRYVSKCIVCTFYVLRIIILQTSFGIV